MTFGRGHGLCPDPGGAFGFLCHNHIGHSARRTNWRPRELQGVPDVPWLFAFFGPSAVAVWCILNGPCWYLVCLVETSGDLAPSSDDDDAVVVRELAACCLLCLPGLEKTWQRPPSFTSQPSYRICSTRFKLLPAPFSCTSLKITSPSASHPACLFCLPTYCNCILLFFYTSASAPSTTSQSQNEDFNCSPRCRCELRLCPEHQ